MRKPPLIRTRAAHARPAPLPAALDAAVRYAYALAGSGVVLITFDYADGGSVSVRPSRGGPPAAAPPPAGAGVKLLGRDSGLILEEVRELGPIAAKALVDRVEVERSKLYVLLADLVDRDLMVEGRDGYTAPG